MQECDINIQGFPCRTKITKKGTWKFKIEDDMGTEHIIHSKYAAGIPSAISPALTTALGRAKQGPRWNLS